MERLGTKLLTRVQVKGSTVYEMHQLHHIIFLLKMCQWLPLAIRIKSKLLILVPKVQRDMTSVSLSILISCHLPLNQCASWCFDLLSVPQVNPIWSCFCPLFLEIIFTKSSPYCFLLMISISVLVSKLPNVVKQPPLFTTLAGNVTLQFVSVCCLFLCPRIYSSWDQKYVCVFMPYLETISNVKNMIINSLLFRRQGRRQFW